MGIRANLSLPFEAHAASDKFSKAIEIEPSNHVLYSNRSGAYASKKEFSQALEDANKTTEIKPDWAKGWGRKGAALHGTGDLGSHLLFTWFKGHYADTLYSVGAKDAFDEALKLDPANAQAKSGLAAVDRAIESEDAGGPGGGLGNVFGDPQIFQKLAANPKTSQFLADPSFMQTLQRVRQNPSDISAAFQDQRMLTAMGVLMGIDMNFMGGKGGDGPMPDLNGSKEAEEDMPMPDARPASSKPAEPKKAPVPEPEPAPEPEDEEAVAAKKAKEEAEAEKKVGTENYKKRNFDIAIQHYEKAWELHKDITYMTNKSAAQFEKGDFEAAIESCRVAIQEGREVMADFKVIAK